MAKKGATESESEDRVVSRHTKCALLSDEPQNGLGVPSSAPVAMGFGRASRLKEAAVINMDGRSFLGRRLTLKYGAQSLPARLKGSSHMGTRNARHSQAEALECAVPL
ncbi:hypothetical protein MRX96_037671 [Rhipicephalus microplus]